MKTVSILIVARLGKYRSNNCGRSHDCNKLQNLALGAASFTLGFFIACKACKACDKAFFRTSLAVEHTKDGVDDCDYEHDEQHAEHKVRVQLYGYEARYDGHADGLHEPQYIV